MVTYNFNLLRDMIIYILFIIVFVLNILNRLDVTESFVSEHSVRDELLVEKFLYEDTIVDLDHISNSNQLLWFFQKVVLPNIIDPNNIVTKAIEEPIARLTFRQIE